jgi:Ca2+-binding EF-hand superfamily protein
MSRRKKILIAAGAVLALGTVAVVTANAYRGHPMGHFGFFGEEGHGRWGFGRGSLTKDEFDGRARERFARIDRNSDGVLDSAEIEASLNERMGRRGPKGGPGAGKMGERMGQHFLAMFDDNRDGKASKDEFLGGVRKRFAELDLDNDGRITDADLPPMMRGRNLLSGPGGGMGRGPGGMLGIFREADANKDGVITLDEAMALGEKRFSEHDRNKDGAIDQVDFDALRKEMADYRVKRFIHHFGADKDGKVTREQFMAKSRERFARMDLNNDGTIARDEMPGFGKGPGRGFRGKGREPWHGRGEETGPGMGPRGEQGPGMMGPGMGPGGPGRPGGPDRN